MPGSIPSRVLKQLRQADKSARSRWKGSTQPSLFEALETPPAEPVDVKKASEDAA
jgi:hypothetical protein